jgi:hypothetical protein
MTALGAFYGAMAVLVAAISLACLWRAKQPDCTPLAASLMLMGLWAVSLAVALLSSAMGIQSPLLVLPVLDLIALIAVLKLRGFKRSAWLLVLAYTFLAQLSLHVVFWALSDKTPLVQWRYKTALDVVYCVQLLTVAFPGVAHGSRHLFRRLGFRGLPALARGR